MPVTRTNLGTSGCDAPSSPRRRPSRSARLLAMPKLEQLARKIARSSRIPLYDSRFPTGRPWEDSWPAVTTERPATDESEVAGG
jgi:hypothetical protein